jgi:hypothetical protein
MRLTALNEDYFFFFMQGLDKIFFPGIGFASK